MSGSEIIKGFREHGVTPYELAELADISSGFLYTVEQNKKDLGFKSRMKILRSEGLAKKYPEAVEWFKTVVMN